MARQKRRDHAHMRVENALRATTKKSCNELEAASTCEDFLQVHIYGGGNTRHLSPLFRVAPQGRFRVP